MEIIFNRANSNSL